MDLEADFLRELAEIEVESMGWWPLEPGVYFHQGSDDTEVALSSVAGVAHAPV